MTDKLINRLKKDGAELDKLAAQRLAEAEPVQPLWAQNAKRTNSHRWLWGIAASIALAVGLVTTLNNNQTIPPTHTTVSNPIMLVDEQLQTPLKTEQRAILEDIKTLKNKFISI